MGTELSDRLFGQNKLFFFVKMFYICVCVSFGERGCICLISIFVADNSFKAILFYIFICITQSILIVFFSGQINHLYDV